MPLFWAISIVFLAFTMLVLRLLHLLSEIVTF